MIPTQRGQDKHGSGAFGASRGARTHGGVDLGAYPGMPILSVCAGTISKHGYPYNPSTPGKGHLRYVQVTDKDGNDHRYFYTLPTVAVGTVVKEGQVIGTTQGLGAIYPGITDHIHYEVKRGKEFLNPYGFM